jgi:hypothetical protein
VTLVEMWQVGVLGGRGPVQDNRLIKYQFGETARDC